MGLFCFERRGRGLGLGAQSCSGFQTHSGFQTRGCMSAVSVGINKFLLLHPVSLHPQTAPLLFFPAGAQGYRWLAL